VICVCALLFGATSCGSDAAHAIYTNRLDQLDPILAVQPVHIDTTVSNADGAALRIDADRRMTIHLAEVAPEETESVVLTYRGHLRAAIRTRRTRSQRSTDQREWQPA
jgi:hypothetical protein